MSNKYRSIEMIQGKPDFLHYHSKMFVTFACIFLAAGKIRKSRRWTVMLNVSIHSTLYSYNDRRCKKATKFYFIISFSQIIFIFTCQNSWNVKFLGNSHSPSTPMADTTPESILPPSGQDKVIGPRKNAYWMYFLNHIFNWQFARRCVWISLRVEFPLLQF